MKIKLSAKGEHLVFSEVEFEDGIQTGEVRRGILEIEDKSEGIEILAKAKKMAWVMGEEKDENGFYPVKRAKAKKKKEVVEED